MRKFGADCLQYLLLLFISVFISNISNEGHIDYTSFFTAYAAKLKGKHLPLLEEEQLLLGASVPALPLSAAWRKGRGMAAGCDIPGWSPCMLHPSPSALSAPCEDAGTDHMPTTVPGAGTICTETDELGSACQWWAAQAVPGPLSWCGGNDRGRNLVLSLCLFLSMSQINASLSPLVCECSVHDGPYSKSTTGGASFGAQLCSEPSLCIWRAQPHSAKASYFWYVNSMRSVSSLTSHSLCTKHLFTVAQAIQKVEAGLIGTDRPSAESLTQILFPLTQKARPEFHLVVDFAQLKQKHSTWARMITQEHVPHASQFCDW